MFALIYNLYTKRVYTPKNFPKVTLGKKIPKLCFAGVVYGWTLLESLRKYDKAIGQKPSLLQSWTHSSLKKAFVKKRLQNFFWIETFRRYEV